MTRTCVPPLPRTQWGGLGRGVPDPAPGKTCTEHTEARRTQRGAEEVKDRESQIRTRDGWMTDVASTGGTPVSRSRTPPPVTRASRPCERLAVHGNIPLPLSLTSSLLLCALCALCVLCVSLPGELIRGGAELAPAWRDMNRYPVRHSDFVIDSSFWFRASGFPC